MTRKLNSQEKAIKKLLGVDDEMAVRVRNEMEIDFSEASQEAIDAETWLAHEIVLSDEAKGITFE